MVTPCLTCGEMTAGTRCDECEKVHLRLDRKAKPDYNKKTALRGYDSKWNALSRKARRLQPFCSDCGTSDDLQADHSPDAWRRKARGLPLRLEDIDVVCGDCNRKRGAARGDSSRSKPSRSS